jgi:RNA polymerase sigma factor (sigma-70 family)
MKDNSYMLYHNCDRCREGQIADPEVLCYYHQKIHDGLIDEPQAETAYSAVFQEDTELLSQWDEVAKSLAFKLPAHWREDAMIYAGLGFRNASLKWDPNAGPWSQYARTILKNRLIDFIRKESRYQERNVVTDSLAYVVKDDAPDAEQLMLAKEERDNLRTAILEAVVDLDERQKDILWTRLLSHEPDTLQMIADRWETYVMAIKRDELTVLNTIREEINYAPRSI